MLFDAGRQKRVLSMCSELFSCKASPFGINQYCLVRGPCTALQDPPTLNTNGTLSVELD